MKKEGVLATIGAFTLWGLLPAYWKAVGDVPALEVLSHRAVWSLTFVAILLTRKKQWKWLPQALKSPSTRLTFLSTTLLLGTNWFVFIWAVTGDHVLDASLGYFINPLISVLLGMFFLRERLRPGQWVAIGIAGGGVTFLTLGYGAFPWIALVLALTFGIYGLLRKTAPLEALEGLCLETAIFSLPALAYLLHLESTGSASFGNTETTTSFLLAFSGVVTALPLVLFAYGVRRVTLATAGFTQYITPTFHFLLGVLVYGETFTETRMVGFGTIWIALLIYSFEGALAGRRRGSNVFSVG